MRLLTLVFCLAAWAKSAQAQVPKTPVSTAAHTHAGPYLPFLKTTTDTLNAAVLLDSLTLFGSPNGGFMSGNSGYNEYAKVQEFDIDSACGVEGFVFWFAQKKLNSQPTDSSRIVLVWYDMDSVTTLPDSGRLMPKTRVKTDTLLLSDIDTSSVFDGSVYLWQPGAALAIRNFAAGLIFDLMDSQDTLALWSSYAGNFGKQTWEYYLNAWTPMYYNWGIDVRFSILALIDRYAGFSQPQPFSLIAFPNPGVETLHLRVPETLKNAGYMLLNSRGQIACERRVGFVPAGEWAIPAHALPSGAYTYLIFEENKPVFSGIWVKN
jgi:hypothetical protein